MLFYYPLEHLYYLGSKGILPISKQRISQYSLWSCRAWAAYVCLQFLHLKEDWKLLKKREKALKKDVAAGAGDVQDQLELEKGVQKRKEAILNELVVNLGYLPLTVHWYVIHPGIWILAHGQQVSEEWLVQK